MVNLLHYIKNDKDNEDNPKNKVDPKNKDNLNEDAIKNEDDIAGTLCPPNMSLEFKVEILWMWGGRDIAENSRPPCLSLDFEI